MPSTCEYHLAQCLLTVRATAAAFFSAAGVLAPTRLLPNVKGTLTSFMKRLIEALK